MRSIIDTGLIFALLGSISLVSGDNKHASYRYQGQDWTGTCATGKRQSPIDIPKSKLEFFNTSSLYNPFLSTKTIMNSKSSSDKHRLL